MNMSCIWQPNTLQILYAVEILGSESPFSISERFANANPDRRDTSLKDMPNWRRMGRILFMIIPTVTPYYDAR